MEDGEEMSGLALNFTQNCLPTSQRPFLSVGGESAVGCCKRGAVAERDESLVNTLFH